MKDIDAGDGVYKNTERKATRKPPLYFSRVNDNDENDWMMEDGYGKLKEKSQHRDEWSRWTFGSAGRQIT